MAYRKVKEALKDSEIPSDYLVTIFSYPQIMIEEQVVERFSRPYEEKSYQEYRAIFITEARISGGIKFYNEQQDLITSVVKRFGIDPYLLISIVGVESKYGEKHQEYVVFNALYTVIHKIPRRANWAIKELAEFLQYCYHDSLNPHHISGSYAGAFGYGQFIPSSFNRYAIDFDGDGVHEPLAWPDALASIANYLVKHGYDTTNTDFSKGSKNWKAIWNYNHSDNYVRVILELREEIIKGFRK